MSDVTHILSAIEQGDGPTADQLLPLVYQELRQLAAAKLAQEKPGQTLQATAIVHEVYDDRRHPKIIVFSLAEATNQQLTERPLFAQIGQVVSAWGDMRLKRAVLRQLDVDACTEISSLQVIVHEILTGVSP